MSKVNVTVEGKALKIGVDTDEDGIDSLSANLYLDEGIKEALKRGEAVEGETVVKFAITPTGALSLKLDTDKDGVPSGDINLNLMEGLNEAGVIK